MSVSCLLRWWHKYKIRSFTENCDPNWKWLLTHHSSLVYKSFEQNCFHPVYVSPFNLHFHVSRNDYTQREMSNAFTDNYTWMHSLLEMCVIFSLIHAEWQVFFFFFFSLSVVFRIHHKIYINIERKVQNESSLEKMWAHKTCFSSWVDLHCFTLLLIPFSSSCLSVSFPFF